MTMTKPIVEAKVELMLEVLDKDLQYVEGLLSELDALRRGLVRRDDAELGQVLDRIRREVEGQVSAEHQRQELRRSLAEDLGWEPRDVTLSSLKAVLSGRNHQALANRQTRLKSLVDALKHEYALTAMLVSDCARLNRSFLHALFGGDTGNIVTYNPRGSARQQMDRTLLSLRL